MRKWLAKHPQSSWQWYNWLAYYCLYVGVLFAAMELTRLYDHRPFAWLATLGGSCFSAAVFTLIVYFLSRERPKSS